MAILNSHAARPEQGMVKKVAAGSFGKRGMAIAARQNATRKPINSKLPLRYHPARNPRTSFTPALVHGGPVRIPHLQFQHRIASSHRFRRPIITVYLRCWLWVVVRRSSAWRA